MFFDFDSMLQGEDEGPNLGFPNTVQMVARPGLCQPGYGCSQEHYASSPCNMLSKSKNMTCIHVVHQEYITQECATACTTSMLCCDGRTSHHVTWFKRLCWQTVQSDHKRVVPKAGLRTTQYLSCTRVHGFIT